MKVNVNIIIVFQAKMNFGIFVIFVLKQKIRKYKKILTHTFYKQRE